MMTMMKVGEKQNLYFFGDGDGSAPIYESMGAGPIQEIDLGGTPVFLCCSACIKSATDNRDAILARTLDLRKRFGSDSKSK